MTADELPPTSKTLLAKLARAASDEEKNRAYARFQETYGPTMLRWSRRWGLQKSDARDVTQEVAFKLLNKMKGPKIDDYLHCRQRAVEALGQLGRAGRPAVPALVKALTDKYPGIRACAATALGQIGPEAKAAFPALTAALKEKDEGVRKAAAEALKKIQQPGK
jgi:HEAT repeat protein